MKEDAENALVEASQTVKNIVEIDVLNCTAKVEKNKIVSYRTNVKIAFTVERA